MSAVTQHFWTDEEIWSVLEYRRARWSLSMIGRQFGATRNAIAGVIHRRLTEEERRETGE